jgi:UDP-glucuronate decarboxylase
LCYVHDLVDGLIRLMNSSPERTGPVNLGNSAEFTMRELTELVLAETGSTSTLVREPLPQGDPKQRQPDISVAKAQLGWTPTVSLRDGLKATTEYFRRLLSEEACFTCSNGHELGARGENPPCGTL